MSKARQAVRSEQNPFIADANQKRMNFKIPEVPRSRVHSYKWVRHAVKGEVDTSRLMGVMNQRLRFDFVHPDEMKDTAPHLLVFASDDGSQIRYKDLVLMKTDIKMARYWREYIAHQNDQIAAAMKQDHRDRIRDSTGKRVITVEDREEDEPKFG